MKVLIISIFFIISNLQYAYAQDFPYTIPQYPFVYYEQNKIINVPEDDYFADLFSKMNVLAKTGKGKVNIVHIGDSHIQADVLTHRLRTRLQDFIPGSYGGIGYSFPYALARSNNPINYFVRIKGQWTGKTNLKGHVGFNMGVGGIAAKTSDVNSAIDLVVREENKQKRPFDKVIVFYDANQQSFQPELLNDYLEKRDYPQNGYVIFYLKSATDTLRFRLQKTNEQQNSFTLNGFSLEMSSFGLKYHSMGINGADVSAWLSCVLLEKQLKALEPDLFIISLGTNDVYGRGFDSLMFETNYRNLIAHIQSSFPGVPIIATTPGDHYIYKKYLNLNTPKAANIIKQLSEELGFAVWDFFQIMGGLNSISLWTKYGLTAGDRLHYNRQGYFFQADLFFNAFLNQWDKFVDKINLKKASVNLKSEFETAEEL